jgi:hypothetical protein
MKKWGFTIIAIFFGFSCLFSQDLVEAAKKEKERRAQLKKKRTVVVTNADLYSKEKIPPAKAALPERQTQKGQTSSPQKPQLTVPSQPRNLPQTLRSPQLDNIDQIDLRVDKIDELDRENMPVISREYATQILESTQYVENPQLALDKPDGEYAEIGEFGSLDLEIDVKNREGDDIAIYAKRQQEGHQNESRNYGVFVEHQGEWEFIGFGGGTISPETFDLGEIPSAKKIRLLFKDFTQSAWTAKPYQQENVSHSMGIDAVKCLHR